jgi:alkanesulfonate monooxygenase
VGARDVRAHYFSPFDYLEQVARAVEAGGFDGALVPFDAQGDDPWIAGAAVARATRHLAVTVEYATTFGTPVYAAKMAATFQRFSHGRLSLKPVLGDRPVPRATVVTPGENAFDRVQEYLEIGRGLWEGTNYSYDGQIFEVAGSGLIPPLRTYPAPHIYLSGNDARIQDMSVHLGDVHLWELTDPVSLPTQIGDLARRAEAAGRTVRSGLRLAVLARPSEEEAWSELHRRAAGVGIEDPGTLVPAAGVWTGFDRLGYGAQGGLVGSYEQVASALDRFRDGGISSFVLEGRPHLEEAYRFAEFVRPSLDLELAALPV